MKDIKIFLKEKKTKGKKGQRIISEFYWKSNRKKDVIRIFLRNKKESWLSIEEIII